MPTVTKHTPRRIHTELQTPAEVAIANAIAAVEQLGPDIRLTDAVVKLADARRLVADFVDACLAGD